MNIQPSSLPPTKSNDTVASGISLQMVERTTRHNQRAALAWGVLAAVAFVFASIVPENLKGFLEFLRWLGLVVALLYAGRWIQSTRLEQLIRYHADAQEGGGEPDWSTIPATSRPSVRSFVSLKEAAEHGWAFGESQGTYDGHPIPLWAEMGGERFVYERLTDPHPAGVVPEQVRLFGRLRYVLADKANEKTPVPPLA